MTISRTTEIPIAAAPEGDVIRQLHGLYIVVAALVYLLFLVFSLLNLVLYQGEMTGFEQITALIIVGFSALTLLWIVLARNDRQRSAAFGLIATLLMTGFLSVTFDPVIGLFVLISVGILGNRTAFIVVSLLISGQFVTELMVQSINGTLTLDYLTTTFPLFVTIFVLGILVRYFIDTLERYTRSAQRSSQLLRTSSTIGAAATQISELKPLFDRVINLIQQQFDYYHVQVFLVNAAGDQAVLIASTGDIGVRLLSRNHQLAIGSQSVIGQVTMLGDAVIARDTDRDEVHYRNELLINTRSEVALPIRDGDVVVGALDVQSVQTNAFDRDDVQALQVIADFLGSAVRNSAQFEEQARVSHENEALLREAENNIRTIQRLNRELTRATWDEFAANEGTVTGVSLEQNRLTETRDWTTGLQTASSERRTVLTTDGSHHMVAVPLTLRGEVIGAIEIEGGQQNDPAMVSMIEEVAQRLAISLENARLYEDSREATAQEQFINALAARYQSTSSVDELLRVTLLELSETLGAQGASIRLGKLENSENGVSGKTNGAVAR